LLPVNETEILVGWEGGGHYFATRPPMVNYAQNPAGTDDQCIVNMSAKRPRNYETKSSNSSVSKRTAQEI